MAPSNKKSAIHVLHVDDDPSSLEISKQILMDMGNFEIDCACCVEEAFKKLASGNFDVVVSDYEMPKKDGLQFLMELRTLNHNNHKEVIIHLCSSRIWRSRASVILNLPERRNWITSRNRFSPQPLLNGRKFRCRNQLCKNRRLN